MTSTYPDSTWPTDDEESAKLRKLRINSAYGRPLDGVVECDINSAYPADLKDPNRWRNRRRKALDILFPIVMAVLVIGWLIATGMSFYDQGKTVQYCRDFPHASVCVNPPADDDGV